MLDRIRLCLQGYNYGNGYIPWAIRRDGGYTVANAIAFSNMQAKKHGWDSYGDKQYPAHVLRYYQYGNYNIGVPNTAIVQLAAKEIGNHGGKKFWSWHGDGTRDHVGFVEKCDGKRVYTIEGNTSDQVARRSYPVGYYEILGYGIVKF